MQREFCWKKAQGDDESLLFGWQLLIYQVPLERTVTGTRLVPMA
jgi:hypothetical protein